MGSGWGTIRAAHLRIEPNCRVCGVRAVTVDHILARAFGGGNDERNLQSLCRVHADVKNHRDRELGKRRRKP
jgi:5-methylcytosine-specific restriction endonuclease McrA